MGICETKSNSIIIVFKVSIGEDYIVVANLYDSFKSILNKFIFEQCPNIRNKIQIALCKGRKVDFNKNLMENNITENDCILLYVDDLINNSLMIESKEDNQYKNYIIAEFEIHWSEEIQIINSYDEIQRNHKWGLLPNHYNYYSIKEELRNEEDIKECEIEIEGKKIPFTYYYKEQNKDKYKRKYKLKIKYSFKKNLTNLNSLFYDCKYMKSIDFTNFCTTNVINMNFMFHNCYHLKKILGFFYSFLYF